MGRIFVLNIKKFMEREINNYKPIYADENKNFQFNTLRTACTTGGSHANGSSGGVYRRWLTAIVL